MSIQPRNTPKIRKGQDGGDKLSPPLPGPLRVEPAFNRLRDQVKAIAGLLEEKSAIPMVHQQMSIIQDIQTDEWWQDVTAPMLETVRLRFLIEEQYRVEGLILGTGSDVMTQSQTR